MLKNEEYIIRIFSILAKNAPSNEVATGHVAILNDPKQKIPSLVA